MRLLKCLMTLAAVAVLAGCAHPLTIGPDLSKVERDATERPIPRNVGYYIPADALERAVTTEGGGGDSVTYKPYKDMEIAFYKMLGNVFKNVTRLKSANDAEVLAKGDIAYVITPEISTNSSSPSAFTWPPTRFAVNLSCRITDASGKFVGRAGVTGNGQAEYEEFKADFSLSGRRAALDAVLKMQAELLKMSALRAE